MNQFGNMIPRFWRGNDPLTFFQGLVSILGVLGLVLSAVLAVVGGGSSGSSDSRTPPPGTPDGFVTNPLARAVEEDEAKSLFEGTNVDGTTNPYGTLEVSDQSVADGALVTGSVLSVVPTDFLPDGALLRIVSISDLDGDTTRVMTTPATISDIVENSDGFIEPEGEIYSLEFEPEPGVVLSDPIANFYSDGEATAIFQKGFEVSETVGGIEMGAKGDLGIDATLGYETSWGLVKGFNTSVTPFVNAGLSVSAHQEVSTEWAKKLVGVSATHKFMIGFVPVFLTTKGDLSLKVSAEASGAVSYEPEVKVNYKAGLKYANGEFSPINKPDASLSGFEEINLAADGQIKASLVPALETKLYGLVGINGEIDGWAKLKGEFGISSSKCLASAGVTPGLNLNASVDLLNLDLSWTHTIVKEEFVLFTSGNLCPFNLPDPGVDPTPELSGEGVTLSNGQASGSANQWGYLEGFVAGKHAWVLSTGDINKAVGEPSFFASTNLGNPGSEELSLLSGGQTWDAATYRVTVIPTGATLVVEYAFASEEYPEYVGSGYNDVMAIVVNGQNCAVVPETGQPISVNTVNEFTNSQYYVDNRSGAVGFNTSFDGLTRNLRCEAPVTPGVPVEVLIAVADTGDAIYDSAVALVEGGIYSR